MQIFFALMRLNQGWGDDITSDSDKLGVKYDAEEREMRKRENLREIFSSFDRILIFSFIFKPVKSADPKKPLNGARKLNIQKTTQFPELEKVFFYVSIKRDKRKKNCLKTFRCNFLTRFHKEIVWLIINRSGFFLGCEKWKHFFNISAF